MSSRIEQQQEAVSGEARTTWARRDGKAALRAEHERTEERVFRDVELAPEHSNVFTLRGRKNPALSGGRETRWAYGLPLTACQCPNCSHVTWMSNPPPNNQEPCSKNCREDLGIIPRKRSVDFIPSRRRTPQVQMERNQNYWRWESEERELHREQWI